MNTIDIIVPTMNRRGRLTSLLTKLEKQTLLPKKIYVLNTLDKDEVDTCSDLSLDNTIVEEIKIDKKDFDHGATRNLAAKRSDADYIIFMTDDALPYDEYMIQNLYRGIKKEIDIDTKFKTIPSAAFARQIAYEDASFTEKLVREFNYPAKSIEKNLMTWGDYNLKNIFLSNVCAIYDRKILEKYGYFREGIKFNEDTLYADKMIKEGYGIIYDAEAKVYHSHDYSFKEQYDRNRLIGESHRLNPEVFSTYKSEGEGIKLVKYVAIRCIKKGKIISLIKFLIECIYRYLGYRKGRYSA